MFKKILFAGVLALAPLAMSEVASAGGPCYRGHGGYGGYGGYGGAVIGYRAPVYGNRGPHRAYRAPNRAFYGSPYRSYYRGGFGRYGYGGYGFGNGIGVNRGGVGLYFGF